MPTLRFEINGNLKLRWFHLTQSKLASEITMFLVVSFQLQFIVGKLAHLSCYLVLKTPVWFAVRLDSRKYAVNEWYLLITYCYLLGRDDQVIFLIYNGDYPKYFRFIYLCSPEEVALFWVEMNTANLNKMKS